MGGFDRYFKGMVRSGVWLLTLSLTCMPAFNVPAGAQQPSLRGIFTVTTTADSGPGSLRDLIFAAGATPETDDVIQFNIPGAGPHTIRPLTPLPDLLDSMTIDGTTQPGYAGTPLVEIDCSATSMPGFVVATTGVTLRGLCINRVDGAAIVLFEGGNHVIEACYIGTDPTGTFARRNAREAIAIIGSGHNVIGGGGAAKRNVLSGNTGAGLTVTAGAVGNVIAGNYIGTNAAGTAAIANSGDGLYLEGATGTVIGGDGPGEGNLISGNLALGAGLFANSSGTRIQGNVIGETVTGSPLGNGADGVYLESSDTLIGGQSPGESNRIANNGAAGIRVFSGQRNTISQNSIEANGWLAIDHGDGGVAPNDDGDGDAGANGLLNVPVLTSVDATSGGTLARGIYESAPNRTFRLEFFSSTECDPFDNGEADTFVGAFDATTDGDGVAPFEMLLPAAVAPGLFVTATATDEDGNTSELSECAQVRLSWDPPSAANGPPENLTVASAAAMPRIFESRGSPGDVVKYNVYQAQVSPVRVLPANLVASAPASKTSMNLPAKNGGIYAVTAVYANGTESAASNEVSTPGAPEITSIRLQGASKLIIEGSNFSRAAAVIVDGLEFVSPAKVRRAGTRIVQKGVLSNGLTVRQYLDTRPAGPSGVREILIGARNETGAVRAIIFSEP